MKSIWQGIPVLMSACVLLCAADAPKPRGNTKKAPLAEKTTTAPAMVIERQPEEGPAIVPAGNARSAAVQTTAQAPAPVVTQQVLPNGLVMLTSSEGFMSSVSVTKNEDGTLVYKCNEPAHNHSAAAKAPAVTSEAGEK